MITLLIFVQRNNCKLYSMEQKKQLLTVTNENGKNHKSQ